MVPVSFFSLPFDLQNRIVDRLERKDVRALARVSKEMAEVVRTSDTARRECAQALAAATQLPAAPLPAAQHYRNTTRALRQLDSLRQGSMPRAESTLKACELAWNFVQRVLPAAVARGVAAGLLQHSLLRWRAEHVNKALPATLEAAAERIAQCFIANRLVSLALTDLPIKAPPAALFWLHLRELNLSRTKLEYLPVVLSCMSGLEALYVCSTPLRHLPASIAVLRQLTHLGLAKSGVELLPLEVAQLKRLRCLQTGRSKVSYLPRALGDLPALRCLTLTKGTIRPHLPRNCQVHVVS